MQTEKTINKKLAMLLGSGAFLAGSASTYAWEWNESQQETPKENAPQQDATTEEKGQAFQPSTAQIATKVDDEMSFDEAFAAARQEVGAGGVFSWHGQYFGTFYATEVDANGTPTVDYPTVEAHDLPPLNYQETELPTAVAEEIPTNTEQTATNTAQTATAQQTNHSEQQATQEPNILGLDSNADGKIDTVLIDINQDGSADAIQFDINQDGELTQDEVQFIHDPNTLQVVAIADPSAMTADINGDGTDEVLIVDSNQDHIIDVVGVDSNQNQNIENGEIVYTSSEVIEAQAVSTAVVYEGEVSADMPEDVPMEDIDNYTSEVSNLEGNFEDYNQWA